MGLSAKAAVREIVVTANQQALNTAITENQIQPEKIISVVFEPRRHLAIGDHEAKYRVLCRIWDRCATVRRP
jgi:chorismate mutase